MLKRVFHLFKIARNLSTSGAVDTINQIHSLPFPIILFFNILSVGSNAKNLDNQRSPGDKLCVALQGMGTTFIKLGQFLATRPDIIGEEMAKSLEKLQDKVPAFDIYAAKERASEWDYAAGHAVAEHAGAIIKTLDGGLFEYGKEDYANPSILMRRSQNLNA